MSGPISTLKQARQYPVLCVAPRKFRTFDVWFSPFLPSLERSWKLGIPCLFYGAVLGKGFMVTGCLEYSFWLWCGWICACLGFRNPQLASRFLTNRISACIAVELVYPWGKGASFSNTFLMSLPYFALFWSLFYVRGFPKSLVILGSLFIFKRGP